MIQLVGAALVAGIAATALNAGDLLLRKAQRDRFQDAVAEFTLWLDYRRPMLWIAELATASVVVAWVNLIVIGAIAFRLMTSDRGPNAIRMLGVVAYINFVAASALVVWWSEARQFLAEIVADPALLPVMSKACQRAIRGVGLQFGLTIVLLLANAYQLMERELARPTTSGT